MATDTESNSVAKHDFVNELQLKELEILHSEVELMLKALRKTEDLCLVTVGAVWAWLFSAQLVKSAAVFLPTVLAALFYAKRLSLEACFEKFHTYIRDKIEHAHGYEGWEHHWDTRPDPMRYWSHGFYLLIIATCLASAVLFLLGILPIPKPPAGK